MTKVTYIASMGLPGKTSRVIDAPSFAKLGIESPELSWNPDNNHTVEMSDEASELLVAALPKQFAIADEQSSDPETVSNGGDDDGNYANDDSSDDDDPVG